MSDKIEGFRGRSIEDVQRKTFLRDLLKTGGSFRYGSSGLKGEPGTAVLFQFKARIIASGVLLRDEKFEKPVRGCAGKLHLDAASIRTFEPVDVEGMRKTWPGFRGFGHVKQRLNPAAFSDFKKRLRKVQSPS